MKGKQTYAQLAQQCKCSPKTIQRRLDQYAVPHAPRAPRRVVVLIDTTYFGRGFGVMLFKDAYTKENLLRYYVKYETNALYQHGIDTIRERGYTIIGIVCDGRKGLIPLFPGLPVQMCQFHQAAIIRRYLTKKPRLRAAQELMGVVELMKQTDRESFEGALRLWLARWECFLNERTVNPETNRSFYTHKRLRSAYRSLKNNLPWLFTWYDHRELNIPNTTNAVDGHFADLKNKLRCHNGLSPHRKRKFLDGFLKA